MCASGKCAKWYVRKWDVRKKIVRKEFVRKWVHALIFAEYYASKLHALQLNYVDFHHKLLLRS